MKRVIQCTDEEKTLPLAVNGQWTFEYRMSKKTAITIKANTTANSSAN